MGSIDLPFEQVWAVDFEFIARDGDRPIPVCLVARELRSGRLVRVWQDALRRMEAPPYPTDKSALFVAYNASAELSCHDVLGWPMPERTLDLYFEFRADTNGRPVGRRRLPDALRYYGAGHMDTEHKDSMIELILSGDPWDADERLAILDYCQSDVDALGPLLRLLVTRLRERGPRALGQALLRGRYAAAVARMQNTGIPIDTHTHGRLVENFLELKGRVAADINSGVAPVYDGISFRSAAFSDFLLASGIPWIRDPRTGMLLLDDDTFKEMERSHPVIAEIRTARNMMSELKLDKLAIGADGRNRASLFPFQSRTGRNQPSNSKFIFGQPSWTRSLIRPEPGHKLGYIDFSSQEIAIAAALSGDHNLAEAYKTGDPYLAFAIQSGMAPAGATKATHKSARTRAKACVLGVQYGMGAPSLAARLGEPVIAASVLLDKHHAAYPTFWDWSNQRSMQASLLGYAETVFGWRLNLVGDLNPRSLMNFPMQSNGAEMLRLACCMATEAGVAVCAPVHDALLIEAPVGEFDEAAAKMRQCMEAASREVLDGFTVRTDVDVVESCQRFVDPDRGLASWDRVMRQLEAVDGKPTDRITRGRGEIDAPATT